MKKFINISGFDIEKNSIETVGPISRGGDFTERSARFIIYTKSQQKYLISDQAGFQETSFHAEKRLQSVRKQLMDELNYNK